jgi:hypothetical protein
MRRILALLVGSLLALVLTAGATPAFAEANPNASCLGLGGSTETALSGPGGRTEISHEVIGDVAPPGSLYSFWAEEHLGSTEACFG